MQQSLPKLGALRRISNLLGTQKKKVPFHSITKSQSSCCRFIWMFCSRESNYLVYSIHEIYLRAFYDDQKHWLEVLQKKVFLKISQNSQENTFAKVLFLINLALACNIIEKRTWHRCFSVSFAKFLIIPFLQNTSGDCFLMII